MGRVLNVTDISILQGSNDTDHDYFHKAILEYSENGEDWTQIGEQYNDTLKIERSDLDITARYVRLRLAATGTSSRRTTGHMSESLQSIKRSTGRADLYKCGFPEADSTDCAGKRVQCKKSYRSYPECRKYVGIKMTALTSASAITAEGTGLDQLAVSIPQMGYSGADRLILQHLQFSDT